MPAFTGIAAALAIICIGVAGSSIGIATGSAAVPRLAASFSNAIAGMLSHTSASISSRNRAGLHRAPIPLAMPSALAPATIAISPASPETSTGFVCVRTWRASASCWRAAAA